MGRKDNAMKNLQNLWETDRKELRSLLSKAAKAAKAELNRTKGKVNKCFAFIDFPEVLAGNEQKIKDLLLRAHKVCNGVAPLVKSDPEKVRKYFASVWRKYFGEPPLPAESRRAEASQKKKSSQKTSSPKGKRGGSAVQMSKARLNGLVNGSIKGDAVKEYLRLSELTSAKEACQYLLGIK